MTEKTELTAEQRALVASTRRFDLRRILGALFLLYGLIVTIVGIVHYAPDVEQAGMPINIYAGLGMLILGILFFVWDRLSPVPEEDIVRNVEAAEEKKAEGEGRNTGARRTPDAPR
jgi:hypothetical protein